MILTENGVLKEAQIKRSGTVFESIDCSAYLGGATNVLPAIVGNQVVMQPVDDLEVIHYIGKGINICNYSQGSFLTLDLNNGMFLFTLVSGAYCVEVNGQDILVVPNVSEEEIKNSRYSKSRMRPCSVPYIEKLTVGFCGGLKEVASNIQFLFEYYDNTGGVKTRQVYQDGTPVLDAMGNEVMGNSVLGEHIMKISDCIDYSNGLNAKAIERNEIKVEEDRNRAKRKRENDLFFAKKAMADTEQQESQERISKVREKAVNERLKNITDVMGNPEALNNLINDMNKNGNRK